MTARSLTPFSMSEMPHISAACVLLILLTVLMGCAAATPAVDDERSPAGFSFSSALDDSGYRTLASVLTDA